MLSPTIRLPVQFNALILGGQFYHTWPLFNLQEMMTRSETGREETTKDGFLFQEIRKQSRHQEPEKTRMLDNRLIDDMFKLLRRPMMLSARNRLKNWPIQALNTCLLFLRESSVSLVNQK